MGLLIAVGLEQSVEALHHRHQHTRPRHRRPRPSLGAVTGTLGGRLVAGVVALVTIVVLGVGSATYFALEHYLDGRLSAQLDQTAGSPQITNALNPRYGTYGQGPSAGKVWLVFLQPNGALYGYQTTGGGNTLLMNLSEEQRRHLVTGTNQHQKLTTSDGTRLVVSAEKACVRTSPAACVGGAVGTPVVAVVGLSTDEMRKTLHRIVLLEAGIGAGAVLLALLASTWGVSVGLGPLKRVTRTAQEVTAEMSSVGGGLDRRVPQTSTTTEVGQLAVSFNTMLDQVEQEFAARRASEERMRQFLADASHELRTPLTSIRGYAELARLQRGRSSGEDPNTADDSLARIESEGTRMSRLVEDLLLLARGDDAGAHVQRAPVDLAQTVRQAVGEIAMAYPQRTITCSVAPELLTSGDEDQLVRVLRNLLVNAAVHTDAASPIHVTGSREGASVVLQVTDAGPGLPQEEAAHVFERFWRADKARTRVRGGSGLGMSIVAQVVAAHGGQVYFDSSVADGSTVTVVLPALEISPWAPPSA